MKRPIRNGFGKFGGYFKIRLEKLLTNRNCFTFIEFVIILKEFCIRLSGIAKYLMNHSSIVSLQ